MKVTSIEAPRPVSTPSLIEDPRYLPQPLPQRSKAITKGKALIVVDMQNDFVSGSLAVPGGRDVVDSIKALYRLTDAEYVVTTQDWHIDPGDHFKRWPIHGEAGTWGAQLVDGIDELPFDARFLKGEHSSGYSGFEAHKDGYHNILLGEWLKAHGVTEVEVVGLALDFCVSATAVDAAKAGFKSTVLLNYTAAADPADTDFTLQTFKKFGVEVA